MLPCDVSLCALCLQAPTIVRDHGPDFVDDLCEQLSSLPKEKWSVADDLACAPPNVSHALLCSQRICSAAR